MERLESFSWPGNIRQLENVIKRAVLIAQDGNITSSIIELILGQESLISKKTHTKLTESPKPLNIPSYPLAEDPSGSTLTGRPYSKVKTEDTEKIIEALTKAGGIKTRAAALLGMTLDICYRMERLQISD